MFWAVSFSLEILDCFLDPLADHVPPLLNMCLAITCWPGTMSDDHGSPPPPPSIHQLSTGTHNRIHGGKLVANPCVGWLVANHCSLSISAGFHTNARSGVYKAVRPTSLNARWSSPLPLPFHAFGMDKVTCPNLLMMGNSIPRSFSSVDVAT